MADAVRHIHGVRVSIPAWEQLQRQSVIASFGVTAYPEAKRGREPVRVVKCRLWCPENHRLHACLPEHEVSNLLLIRLDDVQERYDLAGMWRVALQLDGDGNLSRLAGLVRVSEAVDRVPDRQVVKLLVAVEAISVICVETRTSARYEQTGAQEADSGTKQPCSAAV